MTPAQRTRFDELLDEVVESLPEAVRALMDEVAVIIDDRPSPELVESLRRDGTIEPDADGSDLCGLHSGVALTERSVEDSAALPDDIYLFREAIIVLAGGWEQPYAEDEIYEEIRTTLLHEVGHHFGLDEDDLADLGYD